MKRTLFAVVVALLAGLITAGCAITAGGKSIVGIETQADKDGKPAPLIGGTNITAHHYNYAVQPAPTLPGTPPTPPALQPSGAAVPLPAVSYKTVYPSKWDDPTLVVIQNQSARFVRVKIDDAKEEIRLAPYQTTADLDFDVGEHRVRATVEKPTAAFGMKTVERITSFAVRPDGRSQIIQIYDY